MKTSLALLREQTKSYRHSEAYAQFAHRNSKKINIESWFEFIGYHNNRKKIAKPLKIVKASNE